MAFTLTIPRRGVSAWSAIGSWPAAPLSGIAERHPVASPAPAPIGSALSYEGDIERGRRFMTLVLEGYAGSLAEAAIRFAISHPAMGTILVGMASLQQREGALAAVRKGPLPRAARDRIAML
jgi:aryl-alcohol dehydrogenase-like predicted oxidoreductase